MLKFHYTYIILALSLVLTGYYIDLISFTSLILFHELGHYLTALVLGFRVQKIVIYPYGGLTKIDDIIDKNINKELIVAISGLLFQTIFFVIISILYKQGILRKYTYNIFNNYNKTLFLFNILPIIPLDGSKILNLLLEKIFPYKLSNILILIISIVTLILLLIFNIYSNNYNFIMIISILIYYMFNFYKNLKYMFNRFLLERYLYNIEFKRKIIINNPNKMYKNRTHIIKNNKKYQKERDFLNNLFDLNKNL